MSKQKVIVFTAKKVRTMDPGRPVVEAVAVLDGKVLSTGTMESMQPWLEHYDVTVDDSFKDKVIMPGFIEPHSHCWMSSGFMALHFVGPISWPGRTGGMQVDDAFRSKVTRSEEVTSSILHPEGITPPIRIRSIRFAQLALPWPITGWQW